ncbi:MAG: hypothetical protein NE334_09120 [Lentisphaeraceae bacterium]|nr:hypothetical protein [Lentisphaeraceae bacterium]
MAQLATEAEAFTKSEFGVGSFDEFLELSNKEIFTEIYETVIFPSLKKIDKNITIEYIGEVTESPELKHIVYRVYYTKSHQKIKNMKAVKERDEWKFFSIDLSHKSFQERLLHFKKLSLKKRADHLQKVIDKFSKSFDGEDDETSLNPNDFDDNKIKALEKATEEIFKHKDKKLIEILNDKGVKKALNEIPEKKSLKLKD